MYLSRYHYKNELVSVSIDNLTGELLEFVDCRTGENLIKNSAFNLSQPFWITVSTENGKKKLFGGKADQFEQLPRLQPKISSQKEKDGGISVLVEFPELTDGKTNFNIQASYTVYIPAKSGETRWKLHLESQEDDLLISDVHFPCINGIYFGESWQDDTLVYPFRAGLKVQNPVEVFSAPRQITQWKWQDYCYFYERNNPASGPDENKLYFLESTYSGNLSMTWLDYYGGESGLYFAIHDPDPKICALRADTYGTGNPGMNFSSVHYPDFKNENSWTSPEHIVGVHQGDWHEGARLYRAFREAQTKVIPTLPDWFQKSPGLIAHYDFKYQNGGVVHRYEDIPRLYDEARKLSINHLLFAGWHHDGFDHGFPHYYPDSELGDEQELKDGISNIIEHGGHVSFYINSRIANLKYEELKELIRENAVIKEDGNEAVKSYGNNNIKFATMCVNASGWQRKLKDTLRFITEKIGVDGVYLDQLAMAPPCRCYNEAHGHSTNEWSCGYQKLLTQVSARYQAKRQSAMSFIHEGICDAYGGYSGGQLIQTFFNFHVGAFPEMYKYTFPEQILVDMVYPKQNMAMRPVHVGQISTQLINKAFVTGCYFWIYDLVDDNTFTRDPEQYAYLKSALELRKFWLETFGHGLFCDNDAITVRGSAQVKRFDFDEGQLFACSCENRETPSSLSIPNKKYKEVTIYYSQENRICRQSADCREENNTLTIPLPDVPLCLIRVE